MKYMLCIDDGVFSYNAFRHLVKMANKETDEFWLVNFMQMPVTAEIMLKLRQEKYKPEFDKIREAMKAEHTKILKKFEEMVKNNGVKHYHILLEEVEDIREGIVQKAKILDIDNLVIGSRGYGSITSTLVGSVSEYAIFHAPCPVIVYREKDVANSGSVTHVELKSEHKQ